MRLRDEEMRFMNRYVDPASPVYNTLIARQIDLNAINRDRAVRWAKRYLANGKLGKASTIIGRLLDTKEVAFDWQRIQDPLYKADLLITRGRIMLRSHAPRTEILQILEESLLQLKKIARAQLSEEQLGRYGRLGGQAHNSIGYIYRIRGDYGLALKQYRSALVHFDELGIRQEQASLRNNLAFLSVHLRKNNLALNLINEAIEIREQIGQPGILATSYNTRGIIQAMRGFPEQGEQDCRHALHLLEERAANRDLGLIYNGLGFTLRRQIQHWTKINDETNKDADYFKKAESCFQEAAGLFAGGEPERLWEAWNELGSLHYEWGRLAGNSQGQTALSHFDQAITYQFKALVLAQDHHLVLQLIDTFDDLAKVQGDKAFLRLALGETEAAFQDHKLAAEYLEKIEKELIPPNYILDQREASSDFPEPGHAFWQAILKIYYRRSWWAFRDLVAGRELSGKTADTALHLFVLTVLYAYYYWPQTFAFRPFYEDFSDFFHKLSISPDRLLDEARTTVDKYQVGHRFFDQVKADLRLITG
jgi:tetratricopeptide (TPR) repeat protein